MATAFLSCFMTGKIPAFFQPGSMEDQ